ncbi:cytochrome c oxidase subunit II [Prochlorococcus sp. MIT 1223]|uniref:cytochrome c oxidase subunit II n=1 Tax=Prochlorococcus sp. MIT 1223 TaxID=3096217 RepID=UPI002A765A99|nr:cytochrome c oxidase subunit II [Prochlorococcus sp. MIT 1223]
MSNFSAIITLILSIALSIGIIWIGNNINLLPEQASTNAPIYDELSMVLFSIGTVLFVGMVSFVVYSLIKFRKKPGEKGDGLSIEGNLSLEIFWTAVPAIVVLFVGLYSYDIYDRMGGMKPLSHTEHDHAGMMQEERVWGGIGSGEDNFTNGANSTSIPIEVTAMQFAFLFHYPKGDIISGELHVPVNEKISMRMTSKDVIHAFWVPQFRIKQDVIPGQPTILNFTPTKIGRYPIVCAELCGPYHGGMRSTVVVENSNEYQDWFEKNAKTPSSEL